MSSFGKFYRFFQAFIHDRRIGCCSGRILSLFFQAKCHKMMYRIGNFSPNTTVPVTSTKSTRICAKIHIYVWLKKWKKEDILRYFSHRSCKTFLGSKCPIFDPIPIKTNNSIFEQYYFLHGRNFFFICTITTNCATKEGIIMKIPQQEHTYIEMSHNFIYVMVIWYSCSAFIADESPHDRYAKGNKLL